MSSQNRVRIRAELENLVSRPLNAIKADLNGLASAPGTRSILQGVGMAAGQMAWNQIGRAIGAVTDLIGESKDAYIEDEASQARLRTSLRANVAGYDENTDAIERVLAQRMALGFSDDEQRASLANLVGAYHDEAKALDVQRTAMDLARYSGVSLADASETLVKVHAGNYRALKSLGIATDDIHDETAALAAIQKVAAGQAESYTQTIEGRLTVAETRAAEATEHLGQSTAEVSADFEEAKAGAFEDFATAIDYIADSVNIANQTQERQIELLSVARTQVTGQARAMIDARIAALQAAIANDQVSASLETEERRARGVAQAIDGMTGAAMYAAEPGRSLDDILRELGYGGRTAQDAISGLSSTLSDELFGDAINAGHLADLQQTHAELLKQRDAAGAGAKKYRELTGEIAANEQAQFDLQLQMAEQDGPDAVIAFLDAADKKYGTNNAKLHTMISNLRDVYALLRRFNDLGTIDFGRYTGKIIPGMAEGGIIRATPGGTVVRVGEAGHDEAIVPLQRGAGATLQNAGGSPVIIELHLDDRVLARVTDSRLYARSADAFRAATGG